MIQDNSFHSETFFEEFNLPQDLIRSLYQANFDEASDIQKECIPIIISTYKSLLVQNQSGTGNTLSYIIGMLSRINVKVKDLQAICILPTRELVIQTYNDYIEKITKNYKVKTSVLVKDPPLRSDISEAQLIISTPLQLDQANIDITNVQILVIDYADYILEDQTYINFFNLLFSQLTQKGAQILLYSSTITHQINDYVNRFIPQDKIVKKIIDKKKLFLPTNKHFYFQVRKEEEKFSILENLIKYLSTPQIFVFVNRKVLAERIYTIFTQNGYLAQFYSDSFGTETCDQIISQFKKGKINVLICRTNSICGINAPLCRYVINFNLPYNGKRQVDFKMYLNRQGRSGRFGKNGFVINFVNLANPADSQFVAELQRENELEMKLLENDETKIRCTFDEICGFDESSLVKKAGKKEAALLFKGESDRGNAEAMFDYGFMLHEGEGVETDLKEAARYLRMASEKGVIEAMVKYGEILSVGEGVDVDKKEAARYFKMAEEEGDFEAILRFSDLLSDFEHSSDMTSEFIPYETLGQLFKLRGRKGMNKVSVFAISVLRHIEPIEGELSCLILTLTNELAHEMYDEFIRFSANVSVALVLDEIPPKEQKDLLRKKKPNIIISLPDLCFRSIKRSQPIFDVSKVRLFVIDEAVKIIDDKDSLRRVVDISNLLPSDRNTVVFAQAKSAELNEACEKVLRNATLILLNDQKRLTLHGVQQYFCAVNPNEKIQKLLGILDTFKYKKVAVFASDDEPVSNIHGVLNDVQIPSVVITGKMPLPLRCENLCLFRNDQIKKVLVLNDFLYPRINAEQFDIVVNFDMPNSLDGYISRVGRARCFGTKGLALCFVSSEKDEMMLDEIQEQFVFEIPTLPEKVNPNEYMDACQ